MKSDFEFLLEQAGWPVLLVDAAGVIQRANAAARELFGPTLAERATRLETIWAKENETTFDQFQQKFQPPADQPLVVRFQTKTEPRNFSCRVSWHTVEDRKYFLFQLNQETTSPATLTTFFQKGAAKTDKMDPGVALKQKLDCALQLTRTVSLDFNNALTSILGHTSLILSKMDPQHPWRASLLEVEKSAERAAEIAHDLAAFSQQDKDKSAHEAGNLNNLLRQTVDVFKTSAPAWIQWELNLEPRLYAVKFDEAKMLQAVNKVLENAVQAVDKDGRIEIATRNLDLSEPSREGSVNLPAGSYVSIKVSDNGQGIGPESLPRIFEPFFTTKRGHRGLGLAWVYGIVTNHGGSVAASNNQPHGTTMRVFLPALKKFVHEKSFKDEELRGTQTILIVDDEEILLTMGEMVLTSYGYRVLTASSGQKAMDIIGREPMIDLVITDMVMPNMSGRELIEKLRVLMPDVKIICSTGYVRTSTGDEDAAFLQKPFTSQDLLAKVKQVLTQSEH
ncbi:MAG: ATP-binding protein [Verrucomicrobiota bacterium]